MKKNKYIYRGSDYIHKETGEAYIVSNISELGYNKKVIIELQAYGVTKYWRGSPLELANSFREVDRCVVNGITMLS